MSDRAPATLTKAMILAAGRGSRLAPLTDEIPKPLLDIHGDPLIVHQLRWLKRAGIKQVIINLFHLGQDIRQTLGDGSRFGLNIAYSEEPQLLETGGAIAHARHLLGEQPFLLLNGDIWTDFPFHHLPATLPPHIRAHMVVTPTPSNRPAGDFALHHRRLKRPDKEVERDRVFCGIAVVNSAVVGSRQGTFSMRDLYFDAAAKGELSGQRWDGVWRDIGTLDELVSVRQGPALP